MGETPVPFYSEQGKDLRGVEGWSLFFCISLIFVAPLFDARIGFIALRNMALHRATLGSLFRLASMASVYFGLALYSFLAGLRLWLLKPQAPQFAKDYLIIATCSVIVLQASIYVTSIHTDIWRIVLNRLVYFVVWYSYLQRSRRVAVTYAQA